MSQVTSLGGGGGGGGTVTSITAGTGLTAVPNPIVGVGTISLTVPVTIANGGTNATSMATTDGTVYFDGTRLVTTATGTVGQFLRSGGAGVAPAYATLPASSISITGDSGGALVGAAFTFTGGTTGLTFSGAVATETLTGTLGIANGGTNATSMANTFGVNYYDGTRIVTTAVGSSTQVLTSNGAGVAPTFQAIPASGVTSITGTTGGAQTGAITLSGGTTGLAYGGAAGTITSTFAGITANGGTVSLATDATTSTINVGTGAGVKTSTFGSTNSTSATTVQSGSGALNVTSTNGALTINSGTGTLGVSSDASANTVNIATGAAVKTLTVGSTNTTSATTIQSGTGNIVHNAGFTVDSTGRNKNTVQPCFLAAQTGDQTNVTGNGTAYTVTFTNEIFDQNNNFDGTSTFTAPITGRYFFSTTLLLGGLLIANDLGFLEIVVAGTSSATYRLSEGNYFVQSFSGTYSLTASTIVTMTAGDTATVVLTIFDGTKVVDIFGTTNAGVRTPLFSGYLIC